MLSRNETVLWRRIERLENTVESLSITVQGRLEKLESQAKKLFASTMVHVKGHP